MMEINIFLIEISLSLTVSVLALLLLKGTLHTVLIDLCRGIQRAEFWTRFTQLMLIIGPLLGTLFFTTGDGYTEAFNVGIFREILRYALMGGFITLCGIGIVIWKSIPGTSPDIPQPSIESEV